MSPRVAEAALRLGAHLNPEGSCGVVFFGGEPLLHRDLVGEIVERGEEMQRRGDGRFHFKMTTNGLVLDEDFLCYADLHHILVAMSFDGVREAHDAHRRFPDGRPSFDVLLPRLRLLLASRPYASVLMVVNPGTARYLSESVRFLVEELSARYLIISPNYAGAWEEQDFRTLEREFRKLASLYIRWTREGRKFYLSPFEVKLSSHIQGCDYKKERCELARRQVSVDPEGFLYPCVQFTRAGPSSTWCIGTVFEGIDEGARRRIHDDSEREKEGCRDCAAQARCNNSCGCLNWQTTGSIFKVSPVLCRYERLLMPIADSVGEKLYRRRDPYFLHKHYNAAYPVLSLLEDALSPSRGHFRSGTESHV